MSIERDKIETLLERIRNADHRTFSSQINHLFDYIQKNVSHNKIYRKYESLRKKWGEWAIDSRGYYTRNWTLPDKEDDCKALSYSLYRTIAESNDKTGPQFMLFMQRSLNDNIDLFNNTFLHFFSDSLEDILDDDYVLEMEDTIERVVREALTEPKVISESISIFKSDYSEPSRVAFIMMQFGDTPLHKRIDKSIKNTLKNYKITGLRSDDKEYHDDLFPNVLTYIYGCEFGIAVFERLEQNSFNPNVALEVGYMLALKKKVCLLKDKTMTSLHTDLLGKLYKPFDPQQPEISINRQLIKWLKDKELIVNVGP